jgi:large subunit ribosomal protein L7Ae
MADKSEDKVFEAIEVAKKTGKIRKGVNEATKAIEKGVAKLVVYAKDVNPPEIVMHLEPLCKEKDVKCIGIAKKEELGTAAGLPVGTSAVAIIDAGDAKKIIDSIGSTESKE